MSDIDVSRAEQLLAEREFGEEAIRCIDDVARFAHSLARNGDDADDLVQETYLRALRSRHTFRDGADMRRWLFTICRNVFLRTRERAADIVALDVDPRDDTHAIVRLHGELVASGEDRLLAHIDVGPAIVRALDVLPPVFRAVIVLVDMEGYDYADAAETLGVPVGTVRSRLFRARRLLQESLRTVARDAGIGQSVQHPHGSLPA